MNMRNIFWKIVSLIVIVGLAYASQELAKINKVIEFPIYAAILGIIIGNIPIVNRVKSVANTELFIKIGLILLGASVNFAVIMSVGSRGLLQAVIGMPLVFFFTWYIARLFGVDEKLKAVMATALSVCGVSAAIAAAGSVIAKKEQLTYVIALVILFALPLMVIVPYLAQEMNLPSAVAGAWIGNNIDTTAAVTGAATILGESTVKVASIVKMTQNCFIGIVAFLLALYFAFKSGGKKPSPAELWHRFPKFVLGFIAMSIIATIGLLSGADIKTINIFRKWFFAIAFVCIGIGFSFREIRKVGGKPLAVFAIATAFNTASALGLAWLIFGGYDG